MFIRLRGLFAAMTLLIACATPAAAQEFSGGYLQCAPFARQISGIQLFGNASTWWTQAEGRYTRGGAPKVGAILSFQATSHMRAGHVAVVSSVESARVIRVTHANWSVINGSRGQIERDVEVNDVSPDNDWSQVRVYYASIGKIGTRAYPTNGFIYNETPRLVFASIQ